MPREFPRLDHPIIQAPMAGGPSTPALAAAVSTAGGLGFLAAGYKSPPSLQAEIAATRELTAAPVGVNVFLAARTAVDEAALAQYTRAIAPEADRQQAALGDPRFDDDALADKLDVLCSARPPIVSFTFGCPSRELVQRLHGQEIAVWVTVTDVKEALLAAAAGCDALVAQGVEAGGHRGSFQDVDGGGEIGLLALLRLLAAATDLPLVASGGIVDGAGIAAVLAAGARAAQIGTGFMRCPEAATSAAHREALTGSGETALTRAFSGRRARGIVNAFMLEHGPHAPAAYPQVHHLTAPLRAAARAAGDASAINLWAGQAHSLTVERPAGELVARWSAEALVAAQRAHALLQGHPDGGPSLP